MMLVCCGTVGRRIDSLNTSAFDVAATYFEFRSAVHPRQENINCRGELSPEFLDIFSTLPASYSEYDHIFREGRIT